MAKGKNEQENLAEKSEGYSIAKIFLYIVGFIILVQSEMWICIVVLMAVGFYLLQMGLFKKLRGIMGQSNLPQLITTAYSLAKQKQKQSAVNQVPNDQHHAEVHKVQEIQKTKKRHAVVYIDTDVVMPFDFEEDSFEDIWKDCPDSDELDQQ